MNNDNLSKAAHLAEATGAYPATIASWKRSSPFAIFDAALDSLGKAGPAPAQGRFNINSSVSLLGFHMGNNISAREFE